jgi:hypothetical protein
LGEQGKTVDLLAQPSDFPHKDEISPTLLSLYLITVGCNGFYVLIIPTLGWLKKENQRPVYIRRFLFF